MPKTVAMETRDTPSVDVPNFDGGSRGYHGVFPKDPRSSSTQSLVPTQFENRNINGRRTLLVVYIHGYQGTDTSFQSFPAHVHHYLKQALAESHVVHSKIYPRYKTYKALDMARDNFSAWLEPHESPTTDVILVGHSMGGLLNAEVVLSVSSSSSYQSRSSLTVTQPSRTPYTTGYFRHRILGTVNLDAPFLGLHPGIIVSGISSLFRPKPKSGKESTTELDPNSETPSIASPNSSSYSEFSSLSPTASTMSTETRPGVPGFPFPATTFDPNFNPAFPNDVRLQDRGWMQNIAHFVKKHHSEGIIDAATQHFMSHLEYGSTLLDYNCLKSRYDGLRKLEDVDDFTQPGFPYGPRQVRFIQYYTMCYGVPKKPKVKTAERRDSEVLSPTLSSGSTPRISVQDHSRKEVQIYLAHPSSNGATSSGYNEATSSGVSRDDLSKSQLGQSSERLSQEGGNDPPPSYEEAQSSQTTMDSVISLTEIGTDASSSKDSACPPSRSSVGVDTAAELADAVSALHLDLPAIPALQPKPEEPDLSGITDKDERKQAEKEVKRQQKAHEQAVKSREKSIRERQKLIEKREKKRLQEAEKKRKEELKLKKKEDTATASPIASTSGTQAAPAVDDAIPPPTEPMPGPVRTASNEPAEEFQGPNGKKRKERMFCSLPKTHKVKGQLDPKWVRIFMKDMDEVGAHTGLFSPGEHYDGLVSDVVDVIVGWVQEDATKRAIFAMS